LNFKPFSVEIQSTYYPHYAGSEPTKHPEIECFFANAIGGEETYQHGGMDAIRLATGADSIQQIKG
jgi:hypothetical protein